MLLGTSQKKTWWLRHSIYAIIVVACTACSSLIGPSPGPSSQMLPGEQIWKQGVSAFLFGTNDTHEWSTQNFETQPVIQDSLRSARVIREAGKAKRNSNSMAFVTISSI